jgi:hypothetical protein
MPVSHAMTAVIDIGNASRTATLEARSRASVKFDPARYLPPQPQQC